MADYAIHDTTLEAIADTIRKKDGTQALIDPADYADRINLMGMLEEKTISGTVASCSDGADAVPVKSWEIDINPALTGKSQIVATQFQGVNFFNEDWEVGGINDTTGLPNSDTNKIRSKTFSIIKGGTTCYVSVPQPIRVLFYASDESFISETANIRNNSFAVPSNCSLFKIRGTVDYGTTYNSDIMISYGSTATAYEQYTAPTVTTVSLGRTIYGGQADVVNGTGKSTHGMVTLTAEMINSATSYSYQSKNGIQIASVFPVNVIRTGNHICSAANVRQGASSDASYMWFGSANGNKYLYWIGVLDTMEMTLEQWKTWALSQTIVCVYEEPTSTDFTFTPISPTPETALGVNNFYGDTGDSEVVYRSSGTITPIVPTLISKSITENGTYSAEDDDADGYSQVTVNVPQGSTIPFEKVWSSGNTGAETFTCTEAGKYLFMVGTSARGTATITSSVTADFTSSKQGSDGRGLVIAVYTLAVGDTVTMTNTIVDWVYRVKAVFKTSLSVSATIDSAIVTDGTLSSFSPTFTGDALFVYMAGGRADNNSYDRTYSTDNFEWASKCETQTFIRLSYGSDTPTPSLYGYDGGCALAICLQ